MTNVTHVSVWDVMARKLLGNVADRGQELLQHRLLPVAVEAETDTQNIHNSCERKGD